MRLLNLLNYAKNSSILRNFQYRWIIDVELLVEVGAAAEEKEVSLLSGVKVRPKLLNLKLIAGVLSGKVFISVNE
jgi:hypothetical protein